MSSTSEALVRIQAVVPVSTMWLSPSGSWDGSGLGPGLSTTAKMTSRCFRHDRRRLQARDDGPRRVKGA